MSSHSRYGPKPPKKVGWATRHAWLVFVLAFAGVSIYVTVLKWIGGRAG